VEVVIIRLSAIGDVVHALPVAAALKRRLGGTKITWVVEPAAAPLLTRNPCVDEVLIFPGKALLKNPFSEKSRYVVAAWELFGKIRERRFDVAIELQGLLKSAIIAYLTGAPVRIGFKGTREFADKFLTHPVDVGNYFGFDRHIVDLNLSLVDKLIEVMGAGSPPPAPVEFPLPEPSAAVQGQASRLLAGANQPPEAGADFETNVVPNLLSSSSQEVVSNLPPKRELGEPLNTPSRGDFARQSSSVQTPEAPLAKPFELKTEGGAQKFIKRIVLIPGTTWDSKIWPVDQWCRLAVLLAGSQTCQIILVGGPKEQSINQRIESELKKVANTWVANLTGKTSLLELIAIFKRVDLVVGADTGPLHLAAALGQPKIVGIYGSTPVKRNGPYGEHCLSIALGLDCQPCFEKVCPLGTTACLKEMSAQYVFDRIAKEQRLG
jgi:ADP-heptose:LPS heptosyltransferase